MFAKRCSERPIARVSPARPFARRCAHLGALVTSFVLAVSAIGCGGQGAASEPVSGEPASVAPPIDPVRSSDPPTASASAAPSDAAFAIQLAASLEVQAGNWAAIPFTLVRGAALADVTAGVDVEGLPSGVSLGAPVRVAGPAVAGTLGLVASASAAQGTWPVTVVASAGSTSTARISATLTVRGAAKSVDASFGVHGVVSDPLGDATTGLGFYGRRVLPQPDGKAIVVADCGTRAEVLQGTVTGFCIVRVDASGKRDLTFNGGTMIDLRSDAGRVWLGDAALLDDGKLLIAGWTSANMIVLRRFNTDGTPDSTFGTAGISELPRAVRGVAMPLTTTLHLLRRPGGLPHILFDYGSTLKTLVVRLTAAGTLDPTYGTAGVAMSATTETFFPCGYGIHADDRVFGLGCGDIDADQMYRARFFQFAADGKPDPAFGTDGVEVSTRRVHTRYAEPVVARATGELVATDVTSSTYPLSTFLFGTATNGRAADPHLKVGAAMAPGLAMTVVVASDGSFFAGGDNVAHVAADGTYDAMFQSTGQSGYVRELAPTAARRWWVLSNALVDRRVTLSRVWE